MSGSTLAPSRSDRPGDEPGEDADAAGSPAPKNVTSVQTRSEYRPDIDGIRGAAAIMVMGFHAKVPGFEGAYIGLDLFFVVSGYVITGLLMHEYSKTGTIRWGAFYARRARRLIPAKATMLVGVLILSFFILTPTGAQQETASSAAAAASFVSNIFFWQSSEVDYFGHQPGTAVLLHTWSLSVEEQFYLALPLALLLSWLLAKALRVPAVRTLLFTTLALGLGSVWLAITWADSHPDAAYYLPITRAFEFLIGVALALVARKLRLAEDLREVMGLAGMAIIVFVLWKPMPVDGYPSYWALLPCVAAVLLVYAGVGGPTAATRFLSVKFLVGLGLVSYGWYLWHWPFLVLGEAINLAPPPLWARVALILAALGVAGLSYRFIEGLFYKRSGSAASPQSRSWSSRRVMVTGVVAMSCVAGLSGGAVALADGQADSPRWQTLDAQLTDVPQMPEACLDDDEVIPSRPLQCDLVPFEEGRPTVVLWGDSHAWMFIPALEAAARDRDINLVAFVMGACPTFLADNDVRVGCARSNRLALSFVEERLEDDAPVRVVMGFSYATYQGEPETELAADRNPDGANSNYVASMADLMEEGTPRLFERLGQLDVPVDVLGPTPIIPRNAPLCEARSRPFSCDASRPEAIQGEDDTLEWLGGLEKRLSDDSRMISVSGELCDDDTCFAEKDGVVLYFDNNHLSAEMALRLTPFFLPTVRQVTQPT